MIERRTVVRVNNVGEVPVADSLESLLRMMRAGGRGAPVVRRAIACDVYDGDSLEALLDLGHFSSVRVFCRIRRVDCPEKNTTAGRLVTQWAASWIRSRGSVEWSSIGVDKWRRSLGDVQAEGNPEDCLSGALLAAGLARAYEGERRAPWSEEELAAVVSRASSLVSRPVPIVSKPDSGRANLGPAA